MRIFLAGATGVIGSRLIPLLVEQGHEVAGLTRSPQKVAAIDRAGARGIVADVLDHGAIRQAVVDFDPDLVLHQVTDLPEHRASLPLKLRSLNRVRTVGTENLVSAALAGRARIIAQSIAFPVPSVAKRAVQYLEDRVYEVDGLVLRYGQFYGPGTWSEHAPKGDSVVSVDNAAAQTVALLEEPGGIIQVLDSGTTRLA